MGEPDNETLAAALALLGDLLELEGADRHRVLAYRRGAARIRATDASVAELAEAGRAVDLPDIGDTLQAKVVELVRTGRIEALERARERIPEGLVAVAAMEGLGPRRAARLHAELGVASLDDLRAALAAGRIREVRGMGEGTEAALGEQLARLERGDDGRRVPLGTALWHGGRLASELRGAPGVVDVVIAGSARRAAPTVGDLDIVASESRPGAAGEALAASRRVGDPSGRGRMLVDAPLRVELWAGPPESAGNRLQHATGSAAHNVRLRERAVRAGMSVSEHGIVMPDGSTRVHRDEAGVYAELGLDWIPPERREDGGEIEAAAMGTCPPYVSLADLGGDLHVHSDWSDGRLGIAGMAAAAAARGYRYLAISDHSQRLRMARGLEPDRVRRQWDEIDRLNDEGAPVRLLKATEVDILAATLDFDDDLLAGFDWVTASLHSGFAASGARLTERVLMAIDNPHVDAIGHPTGRMIGKRPAADLDIDRISEAAARTGTALEINGQPQRLDLDADLAARALAAGAQVAALVRRPWSRRARHRRERGQHRAACRRPPRGRGQRRPRAARAPTSAPGSA